MDLSTYTYKYIEQAITNYICMYKQYFMLILFILTYHRILYWLQYFCKCVADDIMSLPYLYLNVLLTKFIPQFIYVYSTVWIYSFIHSFIL